MIFSEDRRDHASGARALETLGTQQCVSEVDQQPRGHEGGERVVDCHDFLLEAIAGVGVADRQGEEAQTQCQQDEIEHGRSLSKWGSEQALK